MCGGGGGVTMHGDSFLPRIPLLVSNMSSSLCPFSRALRLCVVPSPTMLNPSSTEPPAK